MVCAFGRSYRCGGGLLRVAKGFVGHQGEGQVVKGCWCGCMLKVVGGVVECWWSRLLGVVAYGMDIGA
ncbi:hypothetical protein [Bartonella sp. ML71XJBT]|uniref:hypothetical protein n=1 Tax=Bartonella sp. ML71XJBT TaxID=3019094 RepID=UPI002362854D|nr:hypothetical protein [Bartonella sp. ML71XJBT]